MITKGKRKIRVLFLCTHNSCRSQMAEGWARHLKADCIDPYSAGLVQRYMNWNEKSKGAMILKKICGVLVLLGGIYLIYTAP